MTAATSTDGLLTITVPRFIEGSPAEVFDAWADPDLFRRWFEPHRAVLRTAAVDELWYWEHLQKSTGKRWVHYCRYLRVERPGLLEFAWVSEATHGRESRVTLEMKAARGGTELRLTHSGVPDDELGRGHEDGWKQFLEILAGRIKTTSEGAAK